jgi:hypothetical protein
MRLPTVDAVCERAIRDRAYSPNRLGDGFAEIYEDGNIGLNFESL